MQSPEEAFRLGEVRLYNQRRDARKLWKHFDRVAWALKKAREARRIGE